MIELIVSITLLSLIMTLIYGAFFQITTFSKQVIASMQGRQELRLLMKIVLDDLQAIRFMEKLIARNGLSSSEPAFQTGIVSETESGGGPDSEDISFIHFHAAIPSRFFPEAKKSDAEIEFEYRYQFQLRV